MSRYLTIKEELVNEVMNLSQIPQNVHNELITISIESLEGIEIEDKILAMSSNNSLDRQFLLNLAESISNLIWEIVKSSSTYATVQALLCTIFPNEIAKPIAQCYNSHKKRILLVKNNALAVYGKRYKNMNWRVDVELGKRSLSSTIQPSYMLKLDTVTNNGQTNESLHFQSNYANLKNFEKELKLALTELSSVHAQRMTRYIQ